METSDSSDTSVKEKLAEIGCINSEKPAYNCGRGSHSIFMLTFLLEDAIIIVQKA